MAAAVASSGYTATFVVRVQSTIPLVAYGTVMGVSINATVAGDANVVGVFRMSGPATFSGGSPGSGTYTGALTFSGTGSALYQGTPAHQASGTGTSSFSPGGGITVTITGDWVIVPSDYCGDPPASVFGKPENTRGKQLAKLLRAASAAKQAAKVAAAEAANLRDPALAAAIGGMAKAQLAYIDASLGMFDWCNPRLMLPVDGTRSSNEGFLKNLADTLASAGVIVNDGTG